ncbi:mitochondrial tRNA methylthiotransferase CDK5RAP1-like [Lineus longissimus]|uniref:mitochondrial tRNA methylthiotransferase CDK5RAP1-like n=1 Tax=Lineus longissimus TaxID=88925 RepID=UPI002B4E607D
MATHVRFGAKFMQQNAKILNEYQRHLFGQVIRKKHVCGTFSCQTFRVARRSFSSGTVNRSENANLSTKTCPGCCCLCSCLYSIDGTVNGNGSYSINTKDIHPDIRPLVHAKTSNVFQGGGGCSSSAASPSESSSQKSKVTSGPGFHEFMAAGKDDLSLDKGVFVNEETGIPYVEEANIGGHGRKVHIETYGCQMNVNDTEVVWSILEKNGFKKAADLTESDVTLLMTCSIREGAEQKIWHRIQYLKSLKRRGRKDRPAMKIGVLGCMAERLKKKLIEKEKMLDLVCGPDAYRDLPRMLAQTESGQAAVNVLLSLDETYADIMPVRLNQNSPSAFVSIMRGCDNMCSYCIVPFTRGRERSRDIESILEEVRELSNQGIKEVTLLGQNVNSYRDLSELHHSISEDEASRLSKGFSTIYKPKKGGRRFSDLLDKVSLVDPEMRIRFTSPHPKDFPDEVLQLIKERPNICNQIHLPAQSGNSDILRAMRRGYTREAYLDLVYHIWETIPDVSLSSDFIAGFCGETEAAHEETVSLMRLVKYNFAFCFPYSMRQKTHAYHRLVDDVPEDVKQRRHEELISVFREEAQKKNIAQGGQVQLILIEGESKRSPLDVAGRNDGNTKVIIPRIDIPSDDGRSAPHSIKTGDYVAVEITGGSSQTLRGKPLYLTTLERFHRQPALGRAKENC